MCMTSAPSTQQANTSITHPEGEHGGALGAIYAVPDAEVSPVLGHHHVTARHPLDVGAESQQRGLHGVLYVVQVELDRTARHSL